MNKAAAALAGFVLCGMSPAAAQDRLVTTVVPETQRHWDTVGLVGWRGVNTSDVATDWNDWYDVAVFSASAGRYVTPHVKVDLDLSTTTAGRVFGQELVAVPGGAVPTYRLWESRFRRTTVAAALAYQFFENQWVHPFLGAGIEGVRETERIEMQVLPTRGQPSPILMPETRVRYSARPFVAGGVKWYVSERTFIRSDVLSTFSSAGAESAALRIGVGVDF